MTYYKVHDATVYKMGEWRLTAKGIYRDVPYLIISSHIPTCYIGIHKDCPAYNLIGNRSMEEVYFQDNEVTYINYGDGEHRPKDFLWIGWDYGHLGQYIDHGTGYPSDENDRKYTIGDIIGHVKTAVRDLKNLPYAFVNGKLQYMPLNSWENQQVEDCTIEYVSPTFDYGTYDPEVIKNFTGQY